MDMGEVLIAFSITLLAGLSTGIGSALAFFTRKTNTKVLSVSLGFSAGVMLYVSFVEILAKSRIVLCTDLGEKTGTWINIIAFFGGIFFIALIDKLVPSFENPHEIHKVEDINDSIEEAKRKKLLKMGVLSAIVIAIHNFPEGLATFTASIKDPNLGLPIAIAIAIHNIPEGIAVSIPLFYATGSKKKSFWYSLLSGLAEPLGALIGFLILMPFMSDVVFGILFASVAGIMVFISLDELLPTAREYGEPHLSVYGLISGMLVMSVSLILLM